ncbi:MAG: DUF4271 domain-containing protein [Bacteroidia bacterium]
MLLADTTFLFSTNDSFLIKTNRTETILDSLKNDAFLRSIFFKNENIETQKFINGSKQFNRVVPGVKEIKLRPGKIYNWKFWVLISIAVVLITIRLINLKQFDEVLSYAYRIDIYDNTIKGTKTVSYIINISLQLIFISSLALFAIIYAEERRLISVQNGLNIFIKTLVILIIIYLVKIILVYNLSAVIKFTRFAKAVLINAFSVNNIIGIVLVPILLIYTYSSSFDIKTIAFIASIIIIISGVLYRLIKNAITILFQNQYPTIYIIIYLCAFEILPWLIIFKLLINKILA